MLIGYRKRLSVAVLCRLVLGAVASVSPIILSAQPEAVYEVPGISAWSTGKTYGFTFAPIANSGESVTRPLDGMNTKLNRTVTKLMLTSTVAVAQVVGGQPSVNEGERNTTFEFFGGRTLQPNWRVAEVEVKGNFTYVTQPRLGTNDLSFKVRLAPGGTATLSKIKFHGPAGRDWKEAFSAPMMKEWVINGVAAWNAAKKYGFTFSPVREGSSYEDRSEVRGLTDGVSTALIAHRLSWVGIRCTRPASAGPLETACIVGQIAGGNLSVPMPFYEHISSNSVTFEMFGSRKLAPRWTVKSVTVSNGTWVRRPSSGSDDLSFKLKVSSYGDKAATAVVQSVTLVGPSNAASFEDAFK